MHGLKHLMHSALCSVNRFTHSLRSVNVFMLDLIVVLLNFCYDGMLMK